MGPESIAVSLDVFLSCREKDVNPVSSSLQDIIASRERINENGNFRNMMKRHFILGYFLIEVIVTAQTAS